MIKKSKQNIFLDTIRHLVDNTSIELSYFSLSLQFRSKTGVSVNELGDQYVLLGPYFEMKARQEIEEEDFPFHHPLGQAVDRYGSFF